VRRTRAGPAAALVLAVIAPAAAAQDPPLGRGAAFGVLELEDMVRVPAGAALRSRPDPQAEAFVLFEAEIEVPVLERRGRWIRTHHRDWTGWVAPGGEPTVEQYELEALAAGYLVVATSAAERAERIAAARRLLGEENADFTTLGGWPLYTDVRDAGALTRLDRLAGRLPAAYEERFALRAGTEPRRAVVLYRSEDAYRRFASEFTDIGELHGDGHADDAMAVLYLGGGGVDPAAVLVHELTHLINRDVFQRPPMTWIEEGMAEDLGLSRIDGKGNLEPGTIGVRETRATTSGGRFVWSQLLRDWRQDRGRLQPLPALLDLSWAEFVSDRYRQSNYAQSAFFVRYLLDGTDPPTRRRFQEFLAAASRGAASGTDALAEALATSPGRLRNGYELWLTRRAAASR